MFTSTRARCYKSDPIPVEPSPHRPSKRRELQRASRHIQACKPFATGGDGASLLTHHAGDRKDSSNLAISCQDPTSSAELNLHRPKKRRKLQGANRDDQAFKPSSPGDDGITGITQYGWMYEDSYTPAVSCHGLTSTTELKSRQAKPACATTTSSWLYPVRRSRSDSSHQEDILPMKKRPVSSKGDLPQNLCSKSPSPRVPSRKRAREELQSDDPCEDISTTTTKSTAASSPYTPSVLSESHGRRSTGRFLYNKEYRGEPEVHVKASSRVMEVYNDLKGLGPAIPLPSSQHTPPEHVYEHVVDPDFGEKVRRRFLVHELRVGSRQSKYGTEIAETWKSGSTPEEDREQYRLGHERHLAAMDEISESE